MKPELRIRRRREFCFDRGQLTEPRSDVDATTRHHWEAMGYFSPALGDYVKHKLIPDEIGRKTR